MSVDLTTLYAAVGLPERITRQLRQRSYPDGWSRFRVLYQLLSGGVVFAGLWLALIALLASSSIDPLRPGVLFDDLALALSHLAFAVGMVQCGCWASSFIIGLFPARMHEYLRLSDLQRSLSKSGSWFHRRAARGITAATPARFLTEQAAVLRRWWRAAALSLMLAGAAGMAYGVARTMSAPSMESSGACGARADESAGEIHDH